MTQFPAFYALRFFFPSFHHHVPWDLHLVHFMHSALWPSTSKSTHLGPFILFSPLQMSPMQFMHLRAFLALSFC